MKVSSIEQTLKKALTGTFKGILSHSKERKQPLSKIEIRSLSIKGALMIQISEHFPSKVMHKNMPISEGMSFILKALKENFRELYVFNEKETLHVWNVKEKLKWSVSNPQTTLKAMPHNRQKNYLIPEGVAVPFFVALGVMDKTGKVKANKRDKFRQVNRFLEIVHDTLNAFDKGKPIRIVDFGCGKAYLTFALYHYLHEMLNYSIEIIGLDLKADVVEKLQAVCKSCNYKNLHFKQGDIAQFKPLNPIDMMVSLHACDKATDVAIGMALRSGAKVILAVPCCQHELLQQIQMPLLEPLLKHGILKERFAALVTDAARASLLSQAGYKTQVLDFIDLEHTAKNLLIRAVASDNLKGDEATLTAYLAFKHALHIHPEIERQMELKQGV